MKLAALDAPNLDMFTRHNNAVCLWASTLVVDGHTVKKRVRRIEKLIKIANECHRLQNFSSCFALLGGLRSAAVKRLQKVR